MTQTIVSTDKVEIIVTEESTGFAVITTAGQNSIVTLVTEGPQGSQGPQGPVGPQGLGIPIGGTTGELLVKASPTDYALTWTDAPTVDKLGFDVTATESVAPGQLAWNAAEGTLDIGTSGVTYQLGQELSFRCKNVSANTIANGTAVMFMGADATTGNIEVGPMIADGSVPGYTFFGVTTQSIAAGALGYVTSLGKVRGIDTSAFPEDSLLWLDPTAPGGFALVEPAAPNLKIAAAAVIRSDATEGVIFVRAETGRNIADCHDVEVGTGAQDLEYLGWREDSQRWEPTPLPNTAPRSATIGSPITGDSFTLFRTSKETTLRNAVALVSSGSVTFELRYGTDRSVSGTAATFSTVATSTTTGNTATLQNQPIPVNNWVWINITNVTGAVEEFTISTAF